MELTKDGQPVSWRVHQVRKRCKHHSYHLRSLEPRLPDGWASRVGVFDDLGKCLGDAHDHSVLLEDLAGLPEFLRQQPQIRRVIAAAHAERRALRQRVLLDSVPAFDVSPAPCRREPCHKRG